MNEWQEWLQQQQQQPVYPDRLKVMHRLHGKKEGVTCKNCKHLLRVIFSKTYLKCRFTKHTRGPGSDWRVGWPACGLHEEGEQEKIHPPR